MSRVFLGVISTSEKKGRPGVFLRLDSETEALFRQVAEREDRDLTAQFRVILREWLAKKSTVPAQSPGTAKVDQGAESPPRNQRPGDESRRRGAA